MAILINIMPRRTPNENHTSYGIKHILERDTGVYVTNNQMKDAMLGCGFEPRKVDELNWAFCISEKSPAFR